MTNKWQGMANTWQINGKNGRKFLKIVNRWQIIGKQQKTVNKQQKKTINGK